MIVVGQVDTWAESTVADEFHVQLGKRLDAAVNRGELRQCINNRGVRWGHVLVNESVLAPLTKADIRDLRLKAGDILVCEGGEIGRASVWNDELPEAYFLNTLHRLRVKGGYDSRLLVAFFERWATTGELSALVGKSSLAHLTKENLLRVRIPVPSLAEQKRMVEVLLAADNEVVTLERLITKKLAIKQGMMQQLLTGRTRLPGFDQPWVMETVGALARVTGGGTPSTRIATYWGGGIPWFTPGEIRAEGSGLVTHSARTITTDGLANSSATLLPAGTVMVTSRASIGNCAVAAVPVTTNQGFTSMIPKDRRSTWFLYYWTQQHKADLESRAAGSTFLEISASKVAAIPLQQPSLDEQEAIGEAIRDADLELDTLAARLAKARGIKTGMMQELLTGRTRLPVGAAS